MKIVIMPISEGGEYRADLRDGQVSGTVDAPALHELLVKLAEMTKPKEDG